MKQWVWIIAIVALLAYNNRHKELVAKTKTNEVKRTKRKYNEYFAANPGKSNYYMTDEEYIDALENRVQMMQKELDSVHQYVRPEFINLY